MSFNAYVYGTKKLITIPDKEITHRLDNRYVYIRLDGINSLLAVYMYASLRHGNARYKKSKCVGWISLTTIGVKDMKDFTAGNSSWEKLEDQIL